MVVRTTHQWAPRLRAAPRSGLVVGSKLGTFPTGASSDKKQPEAAGQEGGAWEVPSYRLAGPRSPSRPLPCNMIRSKRCPSPIRRGASCTPTTSPRPLGPLSTRGAHAHLGRGHLSSICFGPANSALDLWNETVSASPMLRKTTACATAPSPQLLLRLDPPGHRGSWGLGFPRGQPSWRFQALGSRPGKAEAEGERTGGRGRVRAPTPHQRLRARRDSVGDVHRLHIAGA